MAAGTGDSVRFLPILLVLALGLAGPAAHALAAPYTGHGIAYQGSRDRSEDHQPSVEMVCAAASGVRRIDLEILDASPGDELRLSGVGADLLPVSATARLGEPARLVVHQRNCWNEEVFVVEGASVEMVATYRVSISAECYFSDTSECEEVWA